MQRERESRPESANSEAAYASTPIKTISSVLGSADMDPDLHRGLALLADLAVECNGIAFGRIDGQLHAAVSDMAQLQGLAHGITLPDGLTLRRADGREVRFYALPEGEAA